MVQVSVNPLIPDIHIQILLTDLHTFSHSVSWGNLLKDQSNLFLGIILLPLITSLDCVIYIMRRNLMLITLYSTALPLPLDKVFD